MEYETSDENGAFLRLQSSSVLDQDRLKNASIVELIRMGIELLTEKYEGKTLDALLPLVDGGGGGQERFDAAMALYNEKRYNEAFKYFEEAHWGWRFYEAAYMVSAMRYLGQGTYKSLLEGYEGFKKAADTYGVPFLGSALPAVNEAVLSCLAGLSGTMTGSSHAEQMFFAALTAENNGEPDKALRLYEMADSFDLCDASYRLFLCYSMGTGTVPDVKKAFEYLKKAVMLKFPAAIYEMGSAYIHGHERYDVQANFCQAVQWIVRSVKAGYSAARTTLQELRTYNVTGVLKIHHDDIIKAEKPYPAYIAAYFHLWKSRKDQPCPKGLLQLKKASDLGSLDATCYLGICRYDGLFGLEQDESAGIALLQKAAAGGNDLALLYIIAHLLRDNEKKVEDLPRKFITHIESSGTGAALSGRAYIKFAQGDFDGAVKLLLSGRYCCHKIPLYGTVTEIVAAALSGANIRAAAAERPDVIRENLENLLHRETSPANILPAVVSYFLSRAPIRQSK